MKAVIRWGVILAVAVAVLSVTFAFLDLHKRPILLAVVSIPLLIAINAVAVYFALRETAPHAGYGKQVLNGLCLGLWAGALVFATSWVFTTHIDPSYLAETRQAYVTFLEDALPPEQLPAQLAKVENSLTPVAQARSGFLGTLVTSVVVAAIVAIFKRKR